MIANAAPGSARAARRPSRRALTWAVIVVAGALGLAAGWFVSGQRDAPGASTETLFAIALPDIDGRQRTLAEWRGKVLVVNFWATWCAPCREEMPQFVKEQTAAGTKGLQFVGIAVDDAAKVRQFADEIGVNYPSLIGGFGAMELSRVYGNKVMALPFTIVIDREGKVAHTQLGPLPPERLRRITRELL